MRSYRNTYRLLIINTTLAISESSIIVDIYHLKFRLRFKVIYQNMRAVNCIVMIYGIQD